MPFTRFTTPVNNVSLQPDKPTITATALKAVFDKAGTDIAAFLNSGANNLFGQLEATTAASYIGIGTISGLTGSNIYDLVSDLYTKLTANSSVTTARIADGAVTDVKLSTDSVTTVKITNLNVTTGKLADGAVTSAKIADGTIVNADINAAAAIDKTKISGTAVTLSDTGTVTSTMIANGTIVDADINASAAIGWSKVSKTGSSLADLTTRSAADITSGTLDNARLNVVTTTTDGIMTFSDKVKLDGIQSGAEVNQNAFSTFSVTGQSNVVADTESDTLTLVSGTGISITTDASTDTITITATGTASPVPHADTHIPISAGGLGTDVIYNIDADQQLKNLSLTTGKIADSAVTEAKIANDSITSAKIVNGTIVNVDISGTAAIDKTKISGTAITAADTGTVTSTMIADGTIVNNDINIAAAIDATKIGTGTVDNTEFGYLNNVTSNIQTQLNNKANLSGASFTGNISTTGSITTGTDIIIPTSGKILGDFTSGGNIRTMVQTSTTNSATFFQVIPNGTSQISHVRVFNNQDSGNSSYTGIEATATASTLRSSIFGTGTQLPLTFAVGSTEVARAHTNNNFGIGNTAPTEKLEVTGNIKNSGTITAGGSITTPGNISTTSTGTITSAGLLTASNGLTVTGTVSLPNNSITDAMINTIDASTITTGTISASRLPDAGGSQEGIVNISTQTFAGNKTFVNNIDVNGLIFNDEPVTTSTGANATWINVGATRYELRRSTSARKYKTDEQILDTGMKALDLQPKTWLDKNELQEQGISKRYVGFIAEDLIEIGLEQFVVYGNDGEPDSISYDRLVATLIPILKNQEERIKQLELKLQSLEGGGN